MTCGEVAQMCLLSLPQLSTQVNIAAQEVAFPANKCPSSATQLPTTDVGNFVCCQKTTGRRAQSGPENRHAQFLGKNFFLNIFIIFVLAKLNLLYFIPRYGIFQLVQVVLIFSNVESYFQGYYIVCSFMGIITMNFNCSPLKKIR